MEHSRAGSWSQSHNCTCSFCPWLPHSYCILHRETSTCSKPSHASPHSPQSGNSSNSVHATLLVLTNSEDQPSRQRFAHWPPSLLYPLYLPGASPSPTFLLSEVLPAPRNLDWASPHSLGTLHTSPLNPACSCLGRPVGWKLPVPAAGMHRVAMGMQIHLPGKGVSPLRATS